MPEFVASVDGGGTKTEILWSDRSGNTGRYRIESGCNPQDSDDWLAPIRSALSMVPNPPLHVTFGIPGFGEIPSLDRRIEAILRGLFRQCTVFNDVQFAFHGAFPDGNGVLILSGTGSMAFASGPDGTHRVGGWGDAFGDEGSAYWIGRRALAVASQMIDGRHPDTGFADNLSRQLGCKRDDGVFALMSWALGKPRSSIAAIASLVNRLDLEEQPTAKVILTDAAAELYSQARVAAQLAGLNSVVPWCCSGSVFKSETVKRTLSTLMGSNPQEPKQSALLGGICASARAVGWPMGFLGQEG